jgi:pimeloyl-ACP methyl ester carboxylesterase
MNRLQRALEADGYCVVNHRYPSRQSAIPQLVETEFPKILRKCGEAKKIHFVTHSMGGILVRAYLDNHKIEQLGRVVMLAPPNRGSEVVDRLGKWRLFRWINGPAGLQLGTDPQSVPIRLGPVDYQVGVIAGDRSINWILSALIPGPDDGKVSTERAGVSGMKDFRVIHATHPGIVFNRRAVELVKRFLKNGRFDEEPSR